MFTLFRLQHIWYIDINMLNMKVFKLMYLCCNYRKCCLFTIHILVFNLFKIKEIFPWYWSLLWQKLLEITKMIEMFEKIKLKIANLRTKPTNFILWAMMFSVYTQPMSAIYNVYPYLLEERVVCDLAHFFWLFFNSAFQNLILKEFIF